MKAGKLPKSARYIEVRVNIVRRNLESAVVESKGEVSLPDAAAIQTACRWERHAALAQRWLTKEHDKMTPEQRLNFSREIAKASAERDKAIKMLNLDRDCREDLLDKLYARPAISADGAAGTGDR
ncbi:MAG: hypothetical protein FJ271_09225 [Planctomycetes bacterium]|nr:hypothetical protein [Planctomycetota bacterium]